MKRPSLLTMMLVPTLLTITVGLAGFGVYVDRIESESRLADIDEELVRAASAGEARGRPVDGRDRRGQRRLRHVADLLEHLEVLFSAFAVPVVMMLMIMLVKNFLMIQGLMTFLTPIIKL